MEGGKLGLLLLLVFGSSLASDASEFSDTYLPTDEMNDFDVLGFGIDDQKSQGGARVTVGSHGGTGEVCLLCEAYAAQAQDFIRRDSNQIEIIHTLQEYCSSLPMFEQQKQCFNLMGKFGPVFFSEMSGIKPGNFCQRADHCRKVVSHSQQFSSTSCEACNSTVGRVAAGLKNPATQMELLQMLTMVCGATGQFAAECKTLLTSFGPLLMPLIVNFLESGKLCEMFGACGSAPAAA